MIMVDFSKLREMGPLDQHQLRNNIIIEIEHMEGYIKNNWYTNLISIFIDKQQLKNIPNNQIESFYSSVSVLISNQVRKKTKI
jgi:dynein heavy chain, axonemal